MGLGIHISLEILAWGWAERVGKLAMGFPDPFLQKRRSDILSCSVPHLGIFFFSKIAGSCSVRELVISIYLFHKHTFLH